MGEKEYEVIIGLPVYNGFEFLRKSVESIFNTTNFPHKLVIIESESTDGSHEYCKILSKLYPHKNIEVIHTKKEGPLKAYNKLFAIARKEKKDLYLIQTDVIHFRLFKRDWLYEMNQIAQNKEVGLIAPMGAWGVSGPTFYNGVQWIGGWACYVPLRTNMLLGGYDENYEIGDGVDIDYSCNTLKNGLKLIQANFWVQHHWLTEHEHENNPDLENIRKRNGEYFRKKFNLGGNQN